MTHRKPNPPWFGAFLLSLFLVFSVVVDVAAAGAVHVRGYTTKNGTYVAPHYRSAPDGNFYNNWSTKGNVNPYTGQEGTKVTPPKSSVWANIPSSSGASSVNNSEALVPKLGDSGDSTNTHPSNRVSINDRSKERAEYWKERGYDFNPSFMSPNVMDQKVRNIERAKYWKEKGYDFNPDYMTSISMDKKVKDTERAKYWKQQGYDFNPDFMSDYSMDKKVKDIERARYWKNEGYNFNADFMTAYSMDNKVKDIERAKYWKQKGLTFNPDYMTAYSMDKEARKLLESQSSLPK